MKTAFTFALLALAGGTTLGTDYSKERAVKVENEFQLATETEMTTERDGQPVEGRGGGGSMKSDSTWHIVQVDEVQAHEGKKPTKVKRSYEKVGAEASFPFGDTENTAQLERPFEGTTLPLTADYDAVKAETLTGR